MLLPMSSAFRILFFFLACLLPPFANAAPWTNEAYVWQRQASPEIDAALQNSRELLDGFCVLAAEISWRDRKPQTVRPRLDFAKLAALGKPVGLALRINTLPSTARFSDHTATIVAEATALLAAARDAGLAPSELQIDFDCPESKLAQYGDWLAALKPIAAANKTPLTFTALPAWLKHETQFVALARETGGFVLQVHSLEKPENANLAFTLCDPRAALKWAAQADKLAARAGTPFRIALPTYGYMLGFDSNDRFIGIAAETPRDWPANTSLRTVRANPSELQELAKKLAAQNFDRASGLIWFRLPVESDRLAWTAETFAAVVQNKPIVTKLAAEVQRTRPGLAEIVILNRGQTAEPLPMTVCVAWTRGFVPSSNDGLLGYEFYYDSDARDTFIVTRSTATPARFPDELAPGQSRSIGWIRFDFSDDKPAETFSIHAKIP